MRSPIYKATEADAALIAELEEQSFHTPWPFKAIQDEFKENLFSNIYLIKDEDKLIGYIDFMITFSSATISRIAVHPEYRRLGIGKELLLKMEEVCSQEIEPVEFLTLEVRKSNETAIRLYERVGYQVVKVKKAYYDDGEDAIYMIRSVVK